MMINDRNVSDRSLSILSQAARPDVDPCLVAELAMPGFVIGDLDSAEERWVRSHIAGCTWCSAIHQSFHQVDEALDLIKRPVLENGPARSSALAKSLAATLGLRDAAWGIVETPVGQMLIAVSDAGVCATSWLGSDSPEGTLRSLEGRGFLARRDDEAVASIAVQIDDYFSNGRREFQVAVDLAGVSDFTRRALEDIRNIPFGEVLSYGQVATRIGQPGATQAVGNAMGKNPIPLIVPCHRVVRSDGSMGHYTGGDDIKRFLLKIEGVRYDLDDRQLGIVF